MNSDAEKAESRIASLVSQLVDGSASDEDLAALGRLLQADIEQADAVMDHLLLDTMLADELGSGPLTAVIDLEADDGPSTTVDEGVSTAAGSTGSSRLRSGGRLMHAVKWFSAAAAVLALLLVSERLTNPAFADAGAVLRTALRVHAASLERVYAVEIDWDDAATAVPPKDVQVSTWGNRSWVRITGRGRFSFAREQNGDVWVALGSRRGVRIASDEVAPFLESLADLYSLRVETLLQTVLSNHRLTKTTDGLTHTIVATPTDASGWVRDVEIEIDLESKAVRRLVVRRRLPQRGFSTATFTLVETREPDQSRYQLEGHLQEPYEVFSPDSQPDRRRVVLERLIGPAAGNWITGTPVSED